MRLSMGDFLHQPRCDRLSVSLGRPDRSDRNRRVNLIERQRDPQRERSGHHRAVTDTSDRRRSSLLAAERRHAAGISLPGVGPFASLLTVARLRRDHPAGLTPAFVLARADGAPSRSWGGLRTPGAPPCDSAVTSDPSVPLTGEARSA